MGARGPKPSPNSVTRHKPKQRPRELTADRPDVPDLASAFEITFLPQTHAWWQAWVDSPQAAFFAATDWQTLLRLAPLVDAYWVKPSPQIAAEIRQTEAKLGATAADRDRLGWKIEEPAAEGEQAQASAGARSRPDPRKAGG